jgi:hypothetical protein
MGLGRDPEQVARLRIERARLRFRFLEQPQRRAAEPFAHERINELQLCAVTRRRCLPPTREVAVKGAR